MRIAPRNAASARRRAVKYDVRQAHKRGPLRAPVCSDHCPDYVRAVGCNRYCPAAPRRLSSESDNSPIERLVAPLVFELKRLGVFHPCWSCEGHNDQSGNLLKIPRVWFYADSVVHLRALADAVDRLYAERRLTTRWSVVLTHSDANNPDTTFSLEPEAGGIGRTLQELQNDLRAIADALDRYFWQACTQIAERVG